MSDFKPMPEKAEEHEWYIEEERVEDYTESWMLRKGVFVDKKEYELMARCYNACKGDPNTIDYIYEVFITPLSNQVKKIYDIIGKYIKPYEIFPSDLNDEIKRTLEEILKEAKGESDENT